MLLATTDPWSPSELIGDRLSWSATWKKETQNRSRSRRCKIGLRADIGIWTINVFQTVVDRYLCLPEASSIEGDGQKMRIPGIQDRRFCVVWLWDSETPALYRSKETSALRSWSQMQPQVCEQGYAQPTDPNRLIVRKKHNPTPNLHWATSKRTGTH